MAYAIAQFDATDEAGNLLTDVTVEVRRESGGLQSVFADRDGTVPMGSRFTVANGRVEFYAPGNAYRIRLTKADYVRELRFFAIGLASESDMVIRNFRGEWAADETYRTFEMVTHNGLGFFVSTIEENLNNAPDATTPGSTAEWTFWQQEAPTGWKSVALMTVTGGTADAVTAIVEAGIDPASVVMYVINPVSANTGPVTINGVDLLAFDGLPLGAGYLQAGAPVLFEPVDSDYRLVLDHRFQILADAAQQSADAAAAAFEDLTSLWLGRFTNDAAASAAAGVVVGGQIYWNTTASAFRYWNGVAWADMPYATVADGFVTAAKVSNDAGERDAIRIKLGAAGAELEFTVSQVALLLADMNNQAQFLGPSGNRFADSFDTLTYVDVAGATHLNSATAGLLKPTVAISPRIATGTPTAPLGGTAANVNDNNPATNIVVSPGNITASPVGSRIVAKIDYGTSITITRIEAVGIAQSAGAGANFTTWYSTDNTNWTQLGTAGTSSATPSTFFNDGLVTARYIALVVIAADWTSFTVSVADLNGYGASSPNNLTVRSAVFTAASVPTKMKALINVREVEAATAGTDYTFECSRDAGANWTVMTLSERYSMPSGLRVVEAAETDVSGQPSGTSPRWRFKTLNNKNVELHDVFFYWS
ncbi:hypothetical protein [Devosia sp.]|uniref:hypothetical protein n=1 Tax=Devosia sp. TaxID=1871048 RepID=UPI001ACF8BF0|nr:hypothetical protein [Devosia sp.]MBN9335781.1 hypothetical protein [Devosia sp.]